VFSTSNDGQEKTMSADVTNNVTTSSFSRNDNNHLNQFQRDHNAGLINVYAPIEAYTEQWVHEVDSGGKFIRAYPVPGTRQRSDLPSLSEQWREAARKKYNNGKSISRRGSSRPRHRP
jgi:hypothetical protein